MFQISVVFGEDVAFGGVFRCTVGLKEKYGMLCKMYYVILFFLGNFTTFAAVNKTWISLQLI